MKKRLKNCCFLLITVLVLFVLTTPVAFGAEDESNEQQVLTVAFPETKGLQEVNEDGTYGGLIYDWLTEIAKYTGWKYKFVTGDIDKLMSEMIDGKYDLMGGMFYQKDYEKYFAYPQYAVGNNYCLLISRKDDTSIKNFDTSTFDGKTIGVFKNATTKIEQLKNFLKANKLNCKIKYYEDIKLYQQCLETRDADLMLTGDTQLKETYNVDAKFSAESYYIVTNAKNQKLCRQLSRAIDQIYEANPNMAQELYSKYFPDTYTNSINFSDSDLKYVKSADTLKVAVIEEGYPLSYTKNGKTRGIVPEIFGKISSRTGLKFEYVYAKSYSGALQLVENGEADMAGSYLDDSYKAEEQNLTLTKEYTALDTVTLRNKGIELSDKDLIAAVPKGLSPPADNIHKKVAYYETYEKCLKAVNSGDADYMQITAPLVESLFLNNYYTNVTLNTVDNDPMPISIALPKTANVNLYSVLSKAINNLTEQEIESILQQNMVSSDISKPNLKSLIYSHLGAAIAILVGILVLITATVLLIGRLRLKGRAMELKLEKAEETANAKSAFLSRMSHEIRTPMNAIIGLTSLMRKSEDTSPATKQNLEKIDSSARFLLSLVNDILDMSKIESDKMVMENAPFSMNKLIRRVEDIFDLQMQEKGLKMSFDCRFGEDGFVGDETRLQQVLMNLLSNASKFTPEGGSVCCLVEEQKRSQTHAVLLFQVTDTGTGISPEDLDRIFGSFEQGNQNGKSGQGTGLGLAISNNLVQLMGGELKVESSLGEGSRFWFSLELPLVQGGLPTAEPQEETGETTQLSGMHVLLAEDNEINAEIVVSLLELECAKVDRAADGKQAVDLFADSPEFYYQAILMDVQMPVMDGLEAAERIRAMQRMDAGEVAIIAMTANTFKEDRDRAEAAGMDGFIAKPFETEVLMETLKKYQKDHQ